MNAIHPNPMFRPSARIRNQTIAAATFTDLDACRLFAEGVSFKSVDFSRALLQESHFTSCQFESASFAHTNLTGAVLRACAFERLLAHNAILVEARLEDSSLPAADFTNANFSRARLHQSEFPRAVLRHSVFDSAEGTGLLFRGADLTGCSFLGANLPEADFRGADLTGAVLRDAILCDADFRGAILERVDWNCADLSAALFDEGQGPLLDSEYPSEPLASSDVAEQGEEFARIIENFIKSAARGDRRSFGSKAISGRDPESTAELSAFLEALRHSLSSRGCELGPLNLSMQEVLKTLESAADDEPPSEWQPALLNILQQSARDGRDPEVNEILQFVLGHFSQTKPGTDRKPPDP
jgi:uncharacterized protein YjbI with pentapeptide repeats